MVRFSFISFGKDRVANTFRLSENWQSIDPCRGQAVANTMLSNNRPVVLQGPFFGKASGPEGMSAH